MWSLFRSEALRCRVSFVRRSSTAFSTWSSAGSHRISPHVLAPSSHLLISHIATLIRRAQDYIAVYGKPRLTHRALHENTYMHGCLTRLDPTTHDISTHYRKDSIILVCMCDAICQSLHQMSLFGLLEESEIFLVP